MNRDAFLRALAYTMLLFGIISMPLGCLSLPLAPEPINWGDAGLWIALFIRAMVFLAGFMVMKRLVAMKFNLGYIADLCILVSAALVYVYYSDTRMILPLVLIGCGAVADAVSRFKTVRQQ